MTLSLTIRTADRSPGPNYLRRTAEALVAGGVLAADRSVLRSLHVCETGRVGGAAFVASQLDGTGLEGIARVYVPYGPLTPNQNAQLALSLPLDHLPEWVVFMEDDIDVCARFVESVSRWLGAHAVPDVRLYTFGSTHPAVTQACGAGVDYAVYGSEDFFGSCCYAVRHEDATDLVRWLEKHPTYNGTHRSHDLLLSTWLSRRFRKALRQVRASAPSFVQHVGDVSGLSPSRTKIYRYVTWPGREWSYA